MIGFILVGPGRAGLALGLALAAAGHRPAGILARSGAAAASAAVRLGGAPVLAWDEPLPAADLCIVAVRDDVIAEVAGRLAPVAVPGISAAIHLSGLTPVTALRPLAEAGIATGSFHPLQTLPSPDVGAERLPGAWAAITAGEPLRSSLHDLAATMHMEAFDLADEAKALYHAAAAAAASFPLAALAMASDLFAASGVPFAAARPLVEAITANAFELGPSRALTGPVARGDVGTVAAQLAAVGAGAPEWADAFAVLTGLLAELTGRADEFAPVLGDSK